MNKELQDYYDNRFSMMVSKGWKDLMEDVENMLHATNTLDNVDSVEKLHFRRGEVSIMKWLLGLKDMSEKAFDDLKDEK